MSNLHSRLDSHLFVRLHRTTVFLADAPGALAGTRPSHASCMGRCNASHHPEGGVVYGPLVMGKARVKTPRTRICSRGMPA
jgi:hypothetical protein